MIHPIYGYAYAIVTGTYVGEIFVFIDSTENDYNFISIPKNINRSVPKDKFEFGLENKIIDVVSELDNNIVELLQKQFEYNCENGK